MDSITRQIYDIAIVYIRTVHESNYGSQILSSDDEAESWRCRRERGDFLEECDDTGEERMLGEVGVERDAAGEDPDREERSVERSRKRAWGEERGEERDGIFF